MSNRNTLWANVFVDELARAGLKSVCIAPGSRSTPLTIAFARHGGIRIYAHLDERSAAFFALGLALASDEPVALVCTSGTAAANFFPAIVEAHMSRVPLIVLTADRPPELRYSGANQTIDQVKIYGDYALWAVDAGLPEAEPPAVAIRNLRTLSARAYAKANGIRKGVVHINMPFRKPLEPIEVAGDIVDVPRGAEARHGDRPYTQLRTTQATPAAIPADLHDIIEAHPDGIIVAGINAHRSAQGLIPDIMQQTGYPLIADPVSGFRFGMEGVIGGYETFLKALHIPRPEVIIRVGDVPVSSLLNQYVTTSQPAYYVHLSTDGEWSDDSHLITHLVTVGNRYGNQSTTFNRPTRLQTQMQQIEQHTWKIIDDKLSEGEYFDGAAVYDVVDLIPSESTLFVGNSLPVRLLDQFGKPQSKRIHVYASRGASGIDGNISTALGAGTARPDHPLVAIVGDITFYHDMNGLLAVQRNGVPVTIVLLNNNGGGIFHRLPVKDFEPEFTDLFVMPHGLEFEHAARMYGLEYVRADDRRAFRQAFSESVNKKLSRVIEVRTDTTLDLQRRQEIMDAVKQRIAELDLK